MGILLSLISLGVEAAAEKKHLKEQQTIVMQDHENYQALQQRAELTDHEWFYNRMREAGFYRDDVRGFYGGHNLTIKEVWIYDPALCKYGAKYWNDLYGVDFFGTRPDIDDVQYAVPLNVKENDWAVTINFSAEKREYYFHHNHEIPTEEQMRDQMVDALKKVFRDERDHIGATLVPLPKSFDLGLETGVITREQFEWPRDRLYKQGGRISIVKDWRDKKIADCPLINRLNSAATA